MRRQQRMIAPDHFHHQMMENDVDHDYSIPIPISSGPKKPPATTNDDGIMELLWKNGHVVMQNQNQRHSIPPPADRSDDRLLGAEEFMHEDDEMASWIQYPIDDLYADLLYPVNPQPPIPNLAQIRSPLTLPDDVPRLQNFVHFSRPPPKPRTEAAVESTTMVLPNVVVERVASATAGESTAGTCDLTVLSSSPDGSRGSFSTEGRQRPPEDRKRKARGNDDDEYQSEDIFEFEAAEPKKKKPRRSSTSTKRSRAAEVHNQSERRRRDRINEKMRALQELIPRCNKSDKASMLDEAIEYLKSLQMQVQMMSSMGCPVVPLMYPGMQQYMAPAMGLGMGLNRPPILPYPSIPNVGPRFPMMPAVPYCIPQVPIADPSRAHTSSEADRLAILKNLQARMPSNIVDPYQQFVGMQFPLPQNQAGAAGTKLSSRGNPDNQPFGK